MHNLPKQNAVDPISRNNESIQYLLNTFVALNLVQVFGILGMTRLDRLRKNVNLESISHGLSSNRSFGIRASKSLGDAVQISADSLPPTPSEEQALLPNVEHPRYSSAEGWTSSRYPSACESTQEGLDRGELFMWMCGGLILSAWVLFLATAWLRLRSKDGRGH